MTPEEAQQIAHDMETAEEDQKSFETAEVHTADCIMLGSLCTHENCTCQCHRMGT